MTTPTCPGHLRADGARLGLCLICARLVVDTRTGSLEPAARQATRGGTWGCINFLPLGAAS